MSRGGTGRWLALLTFCASLACSVYDQNLVPGDSIPTGGDANAVSTMEASGFPDVSSVRVADAGVQETSFVSDDAETTDQVGNARHACYQLERPQRTSTSLVGMPLLHAALSGYNCGAGNVQRAIRSQLDVDYFTSGRNYGSDALNRAGWFRMQGWV